MTSPALQEIVALLGCPAAGDPSQYLFERAIEAAGLDWRFVTCDVAATDAAAALAGVAALAFRGCLVSGAIREAPRRAPRRHSRERSTSSSGGNARSSAT